MNSSESGVRRLFHLLLLLYIATVGVAAAYYNWEYARTNGFLRWAVLGEVVPTAKALVWPYCILRSHDSAGTATPTTTEIERTRLTKHQIAEMEVKKFILAINYSQQATYLLNSAPHENLDDYPNIKEILADRRKALEVGQAADVNVLNSVFPELGNRFKDEFLEAVSLFVHGYETSSDSDFRRSKLLNDAWADWYMSHRKAIEDAANGAIGAH